jgi:broad specificity phosphatase PhoE
VAFVSHGGFYMRLICAMLQLPWRQASHGLKSWFTLNNCSISRFDVYKEEISIVYHNRTDHLPDHLIT